MKTGDLVIRKIHSEPDLKRAASIDQRLALGFGIVLSKRMSGTPAHPCVKVYYSKVKRIYEIAESLVEVISESN